MKTLQTSGCCTTGPHLQIHDFDISITIVGISPMPCKKIWLKIFFQHHSSWLGFDLATLIHLFSSVAFSCLASNLIVAHKSYNVSKRAQGSS